MATTTYNPETFAAEAANYCNTQPLIVGLVHPSPTNPRKTFPAEKQKEMVESIKRHGVLQPILVRPWPNDYAWKGSLMPSFEIVAGERRYRAAKEAGLTAIPGLIRQLTTREVLHMQLIENLQREDLHPLEEAEGYELMMKEPHGYTADELGEEIGKSRAYIYGRLKLLALCGPARLAFRDGRLTASTALLIARIPTEALQVKAMKEITEYHTGPLSYRAAAERIQRDYMLRLDEAPFSRTDEKLVPKAGSCKACPKRTGNARDLFSDVKGADVCTDPVCFSKKREAHTDRQIQVAKEKGLTVIAGKEAEKIAPYGVGTYSSMKTPMVLLDDKCYDDPKSRTYREILGDEAEVTLIEDVRKHTLVEAMPEKALAEKLKAAGIKTFAQKQKDENKKTQAKVAQEEAYRERLFANIRAEVTNADLAYRTGGDSQYVGTLRLLAAFWWRNGYDDAKKRIATTWGAVGKNAAERMEAFANGIASFTAGDCWRLLIDLMLASETTTNEWSLDRFKPERLLAMAELFEIDPDEIRDDVEQEAKEAAKEAKAKAKAKPAAKPAKPTKSSLTDGLQVGDRVRVRDNAKGPNGMKRKCCGMEGTVEEIQGTLLAGGLIVARFGDKLVTNLVHTEVEKLPLSAPATPVAKTKAAQAEKPTAPAKKAAPAGGKTAKPAAPGKAKSQGQGKKQKAVIETNEKPTDTQPTPDETDARCDKTADLFETEEVTA